MGTFGTRRAIGVIGVWVLGALAGVALSLASPAAAGAATISVPGDHPTIQAALDAAAPGDVVRVSPGTYVENLDFAGKDVSLESVAGPAETTIDANGSTGVRIGPGGTLRGFTVTNAVDDFGAAVVTIGAGSHIVGNVVTGNTQTAGGYGAGVGGNSSSPLIEGNLFAANACDSQWLSGVVSFINSSEPVIVNNRFEDNPCRGVNLTLPAGNAPSVVNNTFVGNDVGVRVDRRVDTSTQSFRNNILVANGIGLEVDFGTEDLNPVWEHNLVWGNGVDHEGIADQTGTAGNLSDDPVFAAPGDVRLGPDSPAIDAGTSTSAPSTDFSGSPRPIDGDGDGVARVDIGAYEAEPQLADTTPPIATADLVQLKAKGSRSGTFRVVATCADETDAAPAMTAELNGVGVTHGQKVQLRKADEFRVTSRKGKLTFHGPSFTLEVTCTDAAGNTSAATASALD